ncbi:MAG: hypothetical protein MJ003_05365 [Paludibacteraceae bacterium]|nr:hypothetical protein [Paludibacteraceae bacterium]
MKKWFFILLVSVVSVSGYCSDSLFNKVADKLYYSYINQDIRSWKSVIDDFHRNKNMGVDSLDFILEAQYCYVAWCITGDTVNANAKRALDVALKDLGMFETKVKKLPARTVTRNMYEAKIKSYGSAFLAYQMKLNPIKVVMNGWKCVNSSRNAVIEMPDCWFSQIEYGNVMYSMPTVLGGSNINAKKAYLKALKLMEADSNKRTTYHNWLYMHLLLCIADCYKSAEDYENVREFYNKILKIEPSYKYVKGLIPSLDKFKKGKTN